MDKQAFFWYDKIKYVLLYNMEVYVVRELLDDIERQVRHTMAEYNVSNNAGFLGEEPSLSLPTDTKNAEMNRDFSMIDSIASSLPMLIKDKAVNKMVQKLFVPSWDVDDLSWHTKNEVMLRYAIVMHAALQERYPYKTMDELMQDKRIKPVPPQLSVPMWKLSKATGIAPSMSYCLYALWNYKKIHAGPSVALDNIDLMYSFTDTIDEKWFVWIHQVMEQEFAYGIPHMIRAFFLSRLEKKYWNEGVVVDAMNMSLRKAAEACRSCVDIQEHMRDHCDYKTYFSRVRLFYGLPLHIVLEGVEDPEIRGKPLTILGETGGHAPLKQFWIHVLGMDNDSLPYFPKMRDHMSYPHRNLVLLMKDSRVREFAIHQQERNLFHAKRRYNELLLAMLDWDEEHWSHVIDYIQKHGESHGTGKPPLQWLRDLYEKRKSYLLY